MDTPNSGFRLLPKFPIDILAGIVLFVPGEDIGRLKMSGCKSLWSILTCPNVVKSVILGDGGIRFKSWPSFMNEFPSLESLRIENEDGQWWSQLSLTIDQLPSTLRNLFILVKELDSARWYTGWDTHFSCDRFFKSKTTYPIHLDECLPHLETLEIWDKQATSFDWVSSCPPTLTSLHVYHWMPNVALPSSLIHFSSVKQVPPAFPFSLESLRCEQYSNSLPALTSLTSRIPKVGYLAKPEDFGSLPRSLTKLDLNSDLPPETWLSLPHSLQSLSFNLSDHALMSRVGGIHQGNTIPLELLPKSITELSIAGEYRQTWFVSGCSSSLFPPRLTSFKAPCLHLSPDAAKQLPSSLRHLSTHNFCEQVCKHLPEGLTSLWFDNALLSPKTIQCLPKSLTKLHGYLLNCFSYSDHEKEWFDCTTGKIVKAASLPEYSLHKDYPSYFACLPTTLTSVFLLGFRGLQDDFIKNQNFSNLLSLTLWGAGQLSDHCVPLLNRHLTLLDVSPAPKITGKCFTSLPKSLTTLSLIAASEAFYDEDIQHLPRTLQKIVISSSSHLSYACIRDIPRGCKVLQLPQNRRITPRCIPDLPLSMVSVVVATWNWSYGHLVS